MLNYANAFTELGIASVLCVYSIFLFDVSEYFQNTLDLTLIVLINAVVSSQMIASLLVFGKTIRLKIINRKKTKVNPEENNKDNAKINIIYEDIENKYEIQQLPIQNSFNFSENSFKEDYSIFMKNNITNKGNLGVE